MNLLCFWKSQVWIRQKNTHVLGLTPMMDTQSSKPHLNNGEVANQLNSPPV